jgi:hypothetical protein
MTENQISRIPSALKKAPLFVSIIFAALTLKGQLASDLLSSILFLLTLIPIAMLALRSANVVVTTAIGRVYLVLWSIWGIYGVFRFVPIGDFDGTYLGFVNYCLSFVPQWPFIHIGTSSSALRETFYTLTFLSIPYVLTLAKLEKDDRSVNAQVIIGSMLGRILGGFAIVIAFFVVVWGVDAIFNGSGGLTFKPTHWLIFIRRG